MKKIKKYDRNLNVKLLALAAIFFHLVLSSCSIKEPAAPNWDITVAVPLMNRSIALSEIVEDTDLFATGDNGLLNIDFEEGFDRYEVGDQLTVAELTESFASELGDFRVPSPGAQETSLNFGDIYPAAIILHGQSAPVSSFSYETPEMILPSFETIFSVLVETGEIELTVVNRLPVPISEGLEARVLSAVTDEDVFTVVFDSEIGVGSSGTASTSLDGITIPADLKIVLNGSSPGSGGEVVTIDAFGDGLDVEALISDIIASEAQAVIEPLEFSGTDSLALGDSIIVRSGSISSGSIRIDFANDMPLDIGIDLALRDFYDIGGNPVVINLPLLSGQNTSRVIDLSGYSFQPGENQEGSVTHFDYVAQVAGSNGQMINLSREDAVDIDVNLTDFSFSEIRGIIDDISIKLEAREESIDMPDGIDSLQFEAARLELIINNGIGFKIIPDIKVTGYNESTGQSSEVHVVQQIAAASGNPVPTSIVLDKSNSNIVDFINIFPNKISISGDVRIGDGTIEAVIKNTDFIESTVHVSAPLSLSFPAQTIKTDVDTLEIESGVREELQDNVLEGKLYAQIANRIPLGVEVVLQMSGQDTSVFDNPQLVIGPLNLDPAGVVDGRAETEMISEIEIDLSKEEIELFAKEEVFLGLRVSLPSSNQEIIRVYGEDYLNVKAYAEFKYHVDPERE